MTQLSYDITSPDSILDFARLLYGKSLAEATDLTEVVDDLSNKGRLGSMVEKYYFHHVPPNTHEPDFANAGVELKTTGVVKTRQNTYRAKERLVLTMINYMTLVEEDWSTNSLMKKCDMMLLLFYFYQKDVAVYDRKFVIEPFLWSFPEADLKIIENDWKLIQTKIQSGLAHELSEGDTFYLGACRKSAGGTKESLRIQPFSTIKAKRRAFSLKPNYVNIMLSGKTRESDIITSVKDAEVGIDKIVKQRFAPFVGKSIESIAASFEIEMPKKGNKSFYRTLSSRIMGSKKVHPPEFEKAGIIMKTVVLEKSGKPKESMSFPYFKYLDIAEQSWEQSELFNTLEHKFLFVVFQRDENKILRFKRVLFWNMPYDDRQEARRVWEQTKLLVINNQSRHFPGIKESYVAHVRPHGSLATDVAPMPNGTMLSKKCFWLNREYVAEVISNSK